jgi:hypothetical protein
MTGPESEPKVVKSSKLPRRLLGLEELVEAGIDDVTSVVVGGSALEKVAGLPSRLPSAREFRGSRSSSKAVEQTTKSTRGA